MILAKHIITVINSFMTHPSGKTAYNRTVIKYVQWEDTTDRNYMSSGATFIDKHISIIIPKTADTQGKKYVPAKEWGLLPEAQQLLTWTLEPNTDIFYGEVPELTGGYTYTQVRKDFRYCLVKTIDDLANQPIMPHWEIVGI